MRKSSLITILKDYLVGKKVRHHNQHYREVVLEVEDVKIQHRHRQITEDTRSNDWYGESCDWDEIELCFVDGSKITMSLSAEIEIIEPYEGFS